MNRNQIEAFAARWLAAVQHGNLSEFEHLVGSPGALGNGDRAANCAAIQARASALQSAFSELDGHVDELLLDGDRIAWRWTLTGVHSGPFLGERATGKRVRLSGTNFQRLSGDVVVAHYTLVDALGVLHQLRSV
jgi:predicted ester cyclase